MKNLLKIVLITLFLFSDFRVFAQEKISFDSNSLKEQGIIFYNDGKYLEALNCLERLDKSLLSADVLLLIANCYDSLGNYKKASEQLIKSIELNSENPFPYYNLGILQFKNNNITGAIDNFKKTVKYKPDFAEAYYNLGVCYYMMSDFKKAKDNFIISNNLDSSNRNTCYNLVLTFNALKDKSMAEKYLDIYSKMSEKKSSDNERSISDTELKISKKEKKSREK